MANSVKFNADQYANMDTHVAGIIFVYAGKDGKDTAMHFFGKEYEMTAKTQDELLRVMRNLKTTLWMVKEKETELREKNDGIRCKYRSSTPTIIYVNTDKNERVKKYVTECSDFSKFGFFPTKKDLERSARDKKKYIHSSTIAMLVALNFRVEFPKTETAPVETATETTAESAVPIVPVEPVTTPVNEVTTEVANEQAAPVTTQNNRGRRRRRVADKPTETVAEVAETVNEPTATIEPATETTTEVVAETIVEMAAA